MRKRPNPFFLPLFILLTLLAQFNTGYAQAYTESFNNITTLTGSGWYIQNNSSTVGTTTWFQGNETVFTAYSGAGSAYIGVNYNSTAGAGTISNWLVTPNRTLRNGDVFKFYTRKVVGPYADRLELRLSTNGASTNVGTTATGVGDFSTLLLSINPTLTATGYPETWTQYTITISGLPAPTSGRIAFRYFVTNGGPSGANSDYIGIDEVSYTPNSCPVLTISPSGIPAGAAGTEYSQSLSQTGGSGTPAFAVTAGALPPGLTLATNGTLSGTPTATGTFNFTVSVSDVNGCSGSQPYSLIIGCPSNPISFPAPPAVCSNAAPFALNTATPAGGTYSGTGVSGGTFDPSAGTQTVTYTYVDPYGCTHTSNTTVTVTDVAASQATPSSQSACSGSSITTIALTNPGAGVTFSWTRDNTTAATGIAASGTGDISGALVNTTSSPVTVTFTITPTVNGCTGTPFTATVTVMNEPLITSVTGGSVCAPGGVVNLSASGNGTINWYDAPTGGNLVNTGTTYSPNITTNTTYYVESVVLGGGVQTAPMPAQTSPFNGNVRGYHFTAPKSFVITSLYVPTEASTGDQSIAVVKFNANMQPPFYAATTNDFTILFLTQNNPQTTAIAVNIPVQQGDVIGILGCRATVTSYAPAGYTSNIDGLPITLRRLGMQFPLTTTAPQQLWTENGGSIGRVIFEYCSAICTSTPRMPVSATMNPMPDVSASTGSQTICSGSNITTIALSGSVGETTFNWTRDNTGSVTGIPSSGSGNISGTLTNTTNAPVTVTFTVTPVAGSCSGTPIEATITVNPTPSVTGVAVPPDGTYHSGDNLSFTVQYTENVIVNTSGGVPSVPVTLNTGGTVQANYISGSGSSSLVFQYTVSATDQDPDGITTGSSVHLNGGTIQSINGCAAASMLNNLPSTSGITIHNPVPQTISFNGLTAVTYGDPDFDPAATASSGLTVTYISSDPAVATIVAGKVHIIGAGTTTITASQAGDGNYLPATPVQQVLVVNPKKIIVTADAKSKVYGDADPVLTYTYSPALIAGDAFTGALIRTAGENAGSYPVVQNTLALNGNYQLNYVAADLMINKAALTTTAGDRTVCLGNAVATVPVSYTGFKNGQNVSSLSNEPVVNIPSYTAAGNYSLTPSGGSATNYSFSYVSGQLTVLPLPSGNITQMQTGAGVVSGYQLTAPAGVGYTWNTGETTNMITVRSSGNYQVTVVNQQGCSKSFTVQVSLQTLSIPNTFSPNGDGINDYWTIPELANYPNAYVTIVNRDGQVVFESRNFSRWDGKNNGRDLPAGVYLYRVRKAPGEQPVTGWLNLLR